MRLLVTFYFQWKRNKEQLLLIVMNKFTLHNQLFAGFYKRPRMVHLKNPEKF